jgi:hypothetical protein
LARQKELDTVEAKRLEDEKRKVEIERQEIEAKERDLAAQKEALREAEKATRGGEDDHDTFSESAADDHPVEGTVVRQRITIHTAPLIAPTTGNQHEED